MDPVRSSNEPGALAGDDDRWPAFEAFVREQYPTLCAYANRYVRTRDAAEEVVQDVLLRVWLRRHRMAHVELLPYVYRSIAHGAISRIRTDRAIRVRDARLSLHQTEHVEPDSAAAVELENLIRDAIEALPERCRLVFLLSRDAGLTYPVIAERLGISPKTVDKQMVKALRLLRAALRSYLVLLLGIGLAELVSRIG